MSKRKPKKSRKQKRTSSSASKGIPLWAYLAGIAAITVLALSPLFGAGFVDIDDSKLILNKADLFLNRPWDIFSLYYGTPYYKPVTYFTWMLEYRAVGAEPFLFHFNNVLLHVGNTLMVFFLARAVAERFESLKPQSLYIALFTSVLFGVHPMHVESVGWVVERKDVLFTAFYLLGLLAYVRYLNTQKILPLALSATAYLLSCLSKAPGLTMPAILFLLDFVWQRKFSLKLIAEKAGHLAVFAFGLFALGIIGRSGGEGSVAAVMSDKKLARAENIAEYNTLYGKVVLAGLRGWLWYFHSFFPVRLSLGYPREQIISFFGVAIHVFPWLLVLAGGALIWFRKQKPLLFFAHAFFFLTLLPAIVRLGLGIGIYMSDRYVYLPLFGLIFMVVAWVLTLKERGWISRRTKHGILTLLTVLAAISSFQLSRTWKSTETLWTNVIEKYPDVDYAWINRAAFFRDQGRYDEALSDANQGIAVEDNANARIQRGLIYRQMGNPQPALADYDKALSLEPDNLQALTNRGNAYLDLRRFQEAIQDYEKVLEKESWNVKTRVNLAIAYSSLRQFDKAEAQFRRAERYDPNYPDLYVNRAIMFYESQRYADAIPNYLRFLELKPGDHQIYNDLAVVYMLTGQHQNALQSVSQAIQISPVRDYYLLRAQVHEQMGNASAAAQDRQIARQ